MPRGGYRAGAGRPKGAKTGAGTAAVESTQAAAAVVARQMKMSPLDYMLMVINDPLADSDRRDRVAIAAAPYCHSRKEAVGAGKKEEKQQAAVQAATESKFSAAPPPRLVVNR